MNNTLTWDERQAIEKKERFALYQERKTRLKKIVNSLGWTMLESDNQLGTNGFYYPDNMWVCASDGKYQYNLRIGYNNKGKAELSPKFPRNTKGEYISPYGYNEKGFSISFAYSKDLKAIKRDVENRFLPRAIEILEKQYKMVKNSNSYTDKTRASITKLKGEPATDEEVRRNSFYSNNENVSEIKVNGDSIRLELYSLTTEQAKKVLEVLS